MKKPKYQAAATFRKNGVPWVSYSAPTYERETVDAWSAKQIAEGAEKVNVYADTQKNGEPVGKWVQPS